ncbi:unnamed protein product [Absidia cylindrospora]
MTLPAEEAAYGLPSPRELLLSTNEQQQQQQQTKAVSPVDSMLIDEIEHASPLSSCGKPQLPSITDMQPYSPIPRSTTTTPASDEYLRHRMSDMTMTASAHNSGGNSLLHLGQSHSNTSTMSPPSSNTTTILSPLKSSNYDASDHANITPSSLLHYDYRRPLITELNSLPLPTTSASINRRESVTTITSEYDYHSSRSPSPSSFKQHPFYQNEHRQSSDMYYHSSLSASQDSPSYDQFHRRHSIATAEPSLPSSSNRLAIKQRRE